MQPDEGYIKFNIDWEKKEFVFKDDDFTNINSFRTKLFDLGLIGAYPNGIGFGNISIRSLHKELIISGSATGNIKDLKKEHYALVKSYDINNNYVNCVGSSKASSESLSHAAVYESNPKINAVIHTHHLEMWEKYLNILPTTNEKVEFGTPEMANEIKKIAKGDSGIIIMGGHKEGILSFANTLNQAHEVLLKYYKKI